MLNNNKCILVYGLNDEELNELNKANFKLKIINKEMTNMKIKDIVMGLKFETVTDYSTDEKIILFNNYDDKLLQSAVKKVRLIVKGPILAVVTPISSEWTFEYLSEHLIEERNHIKGQKMYCISIIKPSFSNQKV